MGASSFVPAQGMPAAGGPRVLVEGSSQRRRDLLLHLRADPHPALAEGDYRPGDIRAIREFLLAQAGSFSHLLVRHGVGVASSRPLAGNDGAPRHIWAPGSFWS